MRVATSVDFDVTPGPRAPRLYIAVQYFFERSRTRKQSQPVRLNPKVHGLGLILPMLLLD
jgi:hypothetical protein